MAVSQQEVPNAEEFEWPFELFDGLLNTDFDSAVFLDDSTNSSQLETVSVRKDQPYINILIV